MMNLFGMIIDSDNENYEPSISDDEITFQSDDILDIT